MHRSYNRINNILIILCSGILIIMLLSSIASFVFSGKASLYVATITVLTVACAYICCKTKVYLDCRFWIIIFILGVFAKVFVGLFVHAEIVSDMKRCLTAAHLTLKGDMSWQEDAYFILFGYQVPFVLYEAAVLKVFGSTTSLYLLNALLSILSAVLIKMIILNITNDNYCSWFVSALYMILPSTFLRVSVLYNQILGGFFLVF